MNPVVFFSIMQFSDLLFFVHGRMWFVRKEINTAMLSNGPFVLDPKTMSVDIHNYPPITFLPCAIPGCFTQPRLQL